MKYIANLNNIINELSQEEKLIESWKKCAPSFIQPKKESMGFAKWD